MIQKEFNNDDGCNKYPIPQINCWCNEFHGNEVDPLSRGEIVAL
jgi:hypothetical protein